MAGTLPNIPPSFSPEIADTVRVREVQFGDGYSLVMQDGLNATRASTTVTWNVLNQADSDTLITFFKDQGGVNWFFWTAPGESVARKWRCMKWTRSRVQDSDFFKVTADFKQYFDLA